MTEPGQTVVRLPKSQVLGSLSPGMFADLFDGITTAAWTYDVAGGVFTATIDADLDAETCERVRDRLLTADPEAEARRADLRAKRDARPADDDLRAVMDYVLGD